MKFKAYSDIENTYNEKKIRQVRNQFFDKPDIEWIVATKIDGSNFQCSIDENNELIIGKRSCLIGNNADFQNCNHVIKVLDIKNKLITMKYMVENQYNIQNPFILTVYGELCGGMYRHPDVIPVKEANKIQGRISYCPDNTWIPFDAFIYDKDDNFITDIPQTELVELCKKVNLPYEIIKFKGTFDECLNYPIDFIDDTGKILFNLPIIENNMTEGVVLKPNKLIYFNDGSRVIFKHKTEKFMEKMHHKEKKEVKKLTEQELHYYNIMREYMTESRFYSVISKIGAYNEKDFGKILGMYLKDLNGDFEKEYFVEENEDLKMNQVRKQLSREVSDFIRPLFVQNLEN